VEAALAEKLVPPFYIPNHKVRQTITAKIEKIDEDRRLVFGWANVAVDKSGDQVTDSHDDQIDVEDLEAAAYNFTLSSRELNADHEGPTRGMLVESMMFTKEKLEALGLATDVLDEGWWVGFYVEDDDAWDGVKKGKYSMFSIEGWASRVEG
jgi:hypothetical protein